MSRYIVEIKPQAQEYGRYNKSLCDCIGSCVVRWGLGK